MSRAALAESFSGGFTQPYLQPHTSRRPLPAVIIEIGGIPIALQPSNPKFCDVLESRYETFATRNSATKPACRFEIHLDPRGRASDQDARVMREGSLWHFRRGDFDATWD